MAKSIIFVSGKGGVGKTMISTNVSTSLAKEVDTFVLIMVLPTPPLPLTKIIDFAIFNLLMKF